MEVKMNKEIRNYQESMFMGLNLRQCIFSLLAILVAVGIYFGLGNYVSQEMTGWMCILGAAPFAACGFFSVPWHECGAVCLGVYQVRIFIPQAIAVSKRGSVPCLHGRNPCLGRKDTGEWHSPYEKAGTAGKKETDETEKEIRKEWCV